MLILLLAPLEAEAQANVSPAAAAPALARLFGEFARAIVDIPDEAILKGVFYLCFKKIKILLLHF